MKELFLQPGEIIFSREPLRVTTILGSCVSVCIFDHRLRHGGICHYYLPYMNERQDNPNKYGDYAISNLLRRFKDTGSEQGSLTAKIAGGGFVTNIGEVNGMHVGVENSAIAIKRLEDFNIPVAAKSLGGVYGRKIRFNTCTGEVEVQRIKKKATISRPALMNLIVAIGASTGGTEALKDMLIRLPKDIPPIIIVQHIPPVFSGAFAERLDSLCKFPVKEAQNGEKIEYGKVIIARGGKQMKLVKSKGGLFVRLTDDPPVNRFIPSVDYLFSSLAKIKNKKIMGILLTGMGDDGANGLLALRESGAMTIAQDEESSVVYGMPKVAAERGAAQKVVNLHKIPDIIIKFINKAKP